MMFGYARVSARDQNLARQLRDLEEFGCEDILYEKESAKNFARPVYNKMRSKLRKGDVLVVHDLSRFGRNKEEIKKEWAWLIEEDIDIVVLNMPILDTRKYKELEGVGQLISDLVLMLLSWMVEEERLRSKTAQREGIAIAKEKGVYKGRKIKYHAGAIGRDNLIYDEVVRLLATGESVMNIHRKTGLARNTIYAIKKSP